MRTLRADDAGRELLFALVDDPLIRMLFSLHGIIRTDQPDGVGAAGEHDDAAGSDTSTPGTPSTATGPAASRAAAAAPPEMPAAGPAPPAAAGCGCRASASAGCGSAAATPVRPQTAGPTIIPLAAIRRREALDIWPGGAA